MTMETKPKQQLERQGSGAPTGLGGSSAGGQTPSLSVCALAVHDEWQVRSLPFFTPPIHPDPTPSD